MPAPDPLAPVHATLRAMFGAEGALSLTPGLIVDHPSVVDVGDPDDRSTLDNLADRPALGNLADRPAPANRPALGDRPPVGGRLGGWRPAGEATEALLDGARRLWNAQPHAAAALAWKAYTYWLALPAVLGWASARRIPLLSARHVLIRCDEPGRLLTLGLRRDIGVAVLATDPIALSGRPDIKVCADEDALLAELRRSLLDDHLSAMLADIQGRVRIGTRPLLGSLASGIAHGVLRSADALPGPSAETIDRLLTALGIDDLIDVVTDGGEPEIHRKTCCLAFTLPQPKVCRGCCIN